MCLTLMVLKLDLVSILRSNPLEAFLFSSLFSSSSSSSCSGLEPAPVENCGGKSQNMRSEMMKFGSDHHDICSKCVAKLWQIHGTLKQKND